MYRYKFTIEYDGSRFDLGWQRQPAGNSVQGVLEAAMQELTRNQTIFHGAGRTDRGVHALGQVAHCDLRKTYPLKRLREGMNHYLRGSGCRIRKVEPVREDFHSRFMAKMKEYMYIVSTESRVFEDGRAWFVMGPLDIAIIDRESQKLVGHHNFSSFRDHSCQANTPFRTIDAIQIIQDAHRIVFRFRGRSFLHKQIRIMVGTLIDVAKGRLSDISAIMEARRRDAAGQTAPGCGLFLKSVEYSREA